MRILTLLIGVVVLAATGSPASAMRLSSEYSKSRIFWRVFNPDDGIRLVGLAEGTLSSGESVERTHPQGAYQLEIREGSLHGRLLAGGTGAIIRDSEELIFTSSGKLERAQRETLNVTGEIEIQYSLSAKVEREKFSNKLYLYGSRENPRVTMDSFRIVRDATTIVVPGFGTFHPAAGDFSIPGLATVSFGPIVESADVVLSTGAATSGARYSGTGTPFDPATRTMVLVGGGKVKGIEFFVKVTAKLSSPKKPKHQR